MIILRQITPNYTLNHLRPNAWRQQDQALLRFSRQGSNRQQTR
jgi:hypothetical protein